jgi:transcriptional regulator with XRE-family HTH domain
MTDYVPQDAIDFRQYLESILKKYNLTASEFARQLDVNRSTISLYRSGDRLPNCEIITQMALYLVSLGEGGFNPLVREILYCVHVSQMRKAERS